MPAVLMAAVLMASVLMASVSPHHAHAAYRTSGGNGSLARQNECAGVVAWFLVVVVPFWWNELRLAVAYSDGPFGVVDDVVVGMAQHHQVVDVGSSAVNPVNDVVHLAPVGGFVAAGVGAASVAGGDCFALGGGGTPLLAADVDRLAVATQNHWGDLRVAQQPAQLGGGGHPTELQLHSPGLVLLGLEVDDRADVRAFAAFGGQVAVVECVFADRAECFGLAFAQGLVPPERVGLDGRQAGPDRPLDRVEGGSVELALDPTTATGAGFGQV